jgi:hypothetical protein
MNTRRRRAANSGGTFDPRQITEVAAGYFWDPAAGSGSGAAGFSIPEGNGKTAYNIITPSAGVAPALSTVNGRAVVVYTNGTPDKCARVAGNVQRGFTGATMIWGWVSAPGPNLGIWFSHWRAGIQFGVSGSGADLRINMNDGSSDVESRFPLPSGGYAAGPFYVEALFVPSASATSRLQLTIDRVAQVPTVAGSPGTAMRDTADVMGFSSQAGDSSNFNMNGDCSIGVIGLTDGIPSDAARDRMFNHRRLKA